MTETVLIYFFIYYRFPQSLTTQGSCCGLLFKISL